MDLAQYAVNAVVKEGRGVREVARTIDRSPAWVSGRVKAWLRGGDEALAPRSRAPHRQANKMSPGVEDEIVRLRKELLELGLDAGAETIRYHLDGRVDVVPSRSAIWRALKRRGFVSPQPQKKPRSSWIRFEAELPNEMWQTDITHWKLRHGIEVEILDFIDDHSRVVVGAHVRLVTKAQDVVDSFEKIGSKWGFPASVLSDNGMVFTGRARKTRVAFETYLAKLGIEAKHSKPNHPTTCGKIERFHQTLKKYLDSQPRAETIVELQEQVDWFVNYYNTVRPHRACERKPPVTRWNARPKAKPGTPIAKRATRILESKIAKSGTVTVRHNSKLYRIGVGKPFTGARVRLLVNDLHVRIVTYDGVLLRSCVIDPDVIYQRQP